MVQGVTGTRGPSKLEPPTELPPKRLKLMDWVNIVGVVFGIAAAVPFVVSIIHVTQTLTSAYDLLASGKVLNDIKDAEQKAIENVQKAGLRADRYEFRITRDSLTNPEINGLQAKNLNDLISAVGTTLSDGGIVCRAQGENDAMCVRKGDYTHGGARQIVGASLSQTAGSGFSSVVWNVHKVDPDLLVLWFFRNQPKWWLITDGLNANAPFEFKTTATVLTSPVPSTK